MEFVFQEEKLSTECRASSRNHEFNLFTNQPPKSVYLTRNFPHLYTELQTPKKGGCSHDNNILKLRELVRLAQRSGTSRIEIVEVSKMIRNYCRTHMKTLERFLKEFKEHTERCGLANTVGNVGSYIKRKIIQAEIVLEANYATTLERLKRNDDASDTVDESRTFQVPSNSKREYLIGNDSSNNDYGVIAEVLTKTDSCDVNKASCTEDKTDRSTNIVMEFISKFQSRKNEIGTKESVGTDGFVDSSLDYDVMDDSKFRTRRFSGSDFIKKGVLMLRNI